MSSELTNEEIRQNLLKLNYKCGPITDTTRDIFLKKLQSLNKEVPSNKKLNVGISDEELRFQLVSLGQTVAPITSANRPIYLKRLEMLKSDSQKKENEKKSSINLFEGSINSKYELDEFNTNDDEWEPMEVD